MNETVDLPTPPFPESTSITCRTESISLDTFWGVAAAAQDSQKNPPRWEAHLEPTGAERHAGCRMRVLTVVLVPRYDKQNKVGEGAFGVVYRATEKSTGRTVALKKIRLGRGNDGVSREAIREIKSLRELDHENIIEVLKILCCLTRSPAVAVARQHFVLCWCAQLVDVFHNHKSIHLVLEFIPTDLEKIIKTTEVAPARHARVCGAAQQLVIL